MKAVLDHFGLREQPFGVTPDPRFLYFSGTHRETLATLRYGVEMNRGFMALIAEPGMGKTTLLFHLLESMRGAARTSFVFNTQRSAHDLVRALIHDAGIETKHLDSVEMFESFHSLLAQESHAGKQVLLVIDEAQNLDREALEAVRLLSNFETSRAKLLQIILAGQPQLRTRLAENDLAQLRQRISLICTLRPFEQVEVERYVRHRLLVAGSPAELFSPEALMHIAHHSKGIPRNISNLCFHAMSLAFAMDRKVIDSTMVAEAVNDLALEDRCIAVPDQDLSVSRIRQSDQVLRSELAPSGTPHLQVTAAVPAAAEIRQDATPQRRDRGAHGRSHGLVPPPAKMRLVASETFSRRPIVLATVFAVILISAASVRFPDDVKAVSNNSSGPAEPSSSTPFERATPLHKQSPSYPRLAAANRIEGVVVVRAFIEPDGSVERVVFVSGPDALSAPSISAVQRWRFKPALLDGKPVADQQEVRFDFRLKRETQRPRHE